MSDFKKVEAKNGRIMYFKDNKMISVKDIDPAILESLESGIEVKDSTVDEINLIDDAPVQPKVEEAPLPEKKCIFCGQFGNVPKYIHNQLVYICEDDRDTHSMGQIGARVKQLQSQ